MLLGGSIQIGAKLSFIRMVDGHIWSHVPIRSPTLFEEAKKFGLFLDQEVERRKSDPGVAD